MEGDLGAWRLQLSVIATHSFPSQVSEGMSFVPCVLSLRCQKVEIELVVYSQTEPSPRTYIPIDTNYDLLLLLFGKRSLITENGERRQDAKL